MATLRDIKRRIVGVKNTQQITKAMKMVAAARLRKAQENMINARPYSRKISEMLTSLLKVESHFNHPLLEEREVKRIALVVVTSDRGLCGGFNMNVIKTALDLMHDDYLTYLRDGNLDLYCIGKKANDFFKQKEYEIRESHLGVFGSDLNYEFAASFINNVRERFENGEIDKVVIIFNEFRSVVQQKIITQQLLPVIPEKSDRLEEDNLKVEFIYEPDKINIIGTLIPKYLNAQMWHALLESYAAELGARMTAMDMATENAKEMIRSLQLTYNKERQAAITTEILEIVGGANALKEG